MPRTIPSFSFPAYGDIIDISRYRASNFVVLQRVVWPCALAPRVFQTSKYTAWPTTRSTQPAFQYNMPPSVPDFVARAIAVVTNLPAEERLNHAVQAVRSGECTNAQAARDWAVCRQLLRRRVLGHHSRVENGGNNLKLNEVEDLALLAWINTQLSIGVSCFLGVIS